MSKHFLKHNAFLKSAAKTAVRHGCDVRAYRMPINGSGEWVVKGMIPA